MDRLDLEFVQEFDGSPVVLFVVEWFEKSERVCLIFKVKGTEMVILLRLLKGDYVKHQQLGDGVDLEEIKRALNAAFGMDSFLA